MKNVFGERLKELRQERGLGQVKLSEYLGVSKGMISRWENGFCEPTLSNLKNIAEFFNISLDYLAGLCDF